VHLSSRSSRQQRLEAICSLRHGNVAGAAKVRGYEHGDNKVIVDVLRPLRPTVALDLGARRLIIPSKK
jgi:hypothetical protein